MSDNKCKHENYDEYFEKCTDCNMSFMDMIRTVDNAGDARDGAIYWQELFSERDISFGELAEWQAIFSELGDKYNLTEEFEENGII